MQDGIQAFDPRDRYLGVPSQFYWRTQVDLDFHRPSGDVVLPHDAFAGRFAHFVHRLLLEVGIKFAAISRSQTKEFVDDTRNKVPDSDLLQKDGMVRRLKDDACRMESNRTKQDVSE